MCGVRELMNCSYHTGSSKEDSILANIRLAMMDLELEWNSCLERWIIKARSREESMLFLTQRPVA